MILSAGQLSSSWTILSSSLPRLSTFHSTRTTAQKVTVTQMETQMTKNAVKLLLVYSVKVGVENV